MRDADKRKEDPTFLFLAPLPYAPAGLGEGGLINFI
jgi:hypothetical protein